MGERIGRADCPQAWCDVGVNEHVDQLSASSRPAEIYFEQQRIYEEYDGPRAPFEQFPGAQQVQR